MGFPALAEAFSKFECSVADETERKQNVVWQSFNCFLLLVRPSSLRHLKLGAEGLKHVSLAQFERMCSFMARNGLIGVKSSRCEGVG